MWCLAWGWWVSAGGLGRLSFGLDECGAEVRHTKVALLRAGFRKVGCIEAVLAGGSMMIIHGGGAWGARQRRDSGQELGQGLGEAGLSAASL